MFLPRREYSIKKAQEIMYTEIIYRPFHPKDILYLGQPQLCYSVYIA